MSHNHIHLTDEAIDLRGKIIGKSLGPANNLCEVDVVKILTVALCQALFQLVDPMVGVEIIREYMDQAEDDIMAAIPISPEIASEIASAFKKR